MLGGSKRGISSGFWFLFLLGILFSFGAGCSTSNSAKKKAETKDEDVHKGPVLEKMTARIYRGSNLESMVQAQRAVFDLSKSEALLYSVKVSFYQDGKWGGDLFSQKGIMYLKEQPEKKIDKHDIFLDGRVSYKDKSGTTISTPQLHYFARSGRLASGGGAFQQRQLTEETEIVFTGSSFETDKDLKSFKGRDARIKIRALEPSTKGSTKK